MVVLLAAVGLLSLGGCEVFGYIAQGFSDHDVKAVHELPDRPTLVIVDDPTGSLGSAGTAVAIASRIGFELTEAQVVSVVVDQSLLIDLARQLGDEYGRTPIDQLGRHLGAAQVVYVHMESVAAKRQGTLMDLTAYLGVKVVDVEAGRRVFPAGGVETDAGADPGRGWPMAVTVRDMGAAVQSQAQQQQLVVQLADEVGSQVAELFYAHPARPRDRAID